MYCFLLIHEVSALMLASVSSAESNISSLLERTRRNSESTFVSVGRGKSAAQVVLFYMQSLGVARILNPVALKVHCSVSPGAVRVPKPARMTGNVSTKPTMLFRQLFEKDSSTYTYLLADMAHPDRPAVLVDPVDKTADRDAQLVKELGLKLLYVMNTHVHADHVTGTGLLKNKVPGVKSAISKASDAKGDVLLEAGDRVVFGNMFLEVRPTPGHTKGCVTYVTGEGPEQPHPQLAFTGDALLIRGCGRTDFQGGDAGQLYKSVHAQILSLPKDTLLYPAHDYKGQTVTTVGEELLFNPRLSKDEESFKTIMAIYELLPAQKHEEIWVCRIRR